MPLSLFGKKSSSVNSNDFSTNVGPKGRALTQFRDTFMTSSFCYNKRIGGKDYKFDPNHPIKKYQGKEFNSGTPICESHLKLSQRYPKIKQSSQWGIGRSKIWIFILLDIIFCICAEELGVSFVLLADPLPNFIIDVAVCLYHAWLYNPILALITLILKGFILIPSVVGLVVGVFPWHYIILIIGIFQRRNVRSKVAKNQDFFVTKYGSQGVAKDRVFQYLYPYPLVDWKSKGAEVVHPLQEIVQKSTEVKSTIDVTPTKVPKRKKVSAKSQSPTTQVVASMIKKRFS